MYLAHDLESFNYEFHYKECGHAGGSGWNLVQVLQY